jgi:hypothetical protein
MAWCLVKLEELHLALLRPSPVAPVYIQPRTYEYLRLWRHFLKRVAISRKLSGTIGDYIPVSSVLQLGITFPEAQCYNWELHSQTKEKIQKNYT